MDALNTYLASTGQPTFDFFGPNANCTIDLCSPRWSVYGYKPSLSANLALLAIFFAALVAHILLGLRSRTWSFMACMISGCLDEMLGYAARVWMFSDLWNFDAFMIQVVCITTAPVFYCAGIYMVLANTMSTFAPTLSRFRPSFLYWFFIPCDLVSLVLQGVGGALSATTAGLSQTGINIALAGLAFQVATLVLFCAVYVDFVWRYHRLGFGQRLRVFYVFEALAFLMILARCAFRVGELSDGYGGPLVKREDLFIGFEGVLIVVAAFALCVGHPGLILSQSRRKKSPTEPISLETGPDK
ncbi:hypothetical protein M406DRAFT_32933 [Cryphonectria parasitica EP155]|uniref:Sphingoid long-chain base transporter RSB1 n=1 Tax=Cryphonectria parasitica (strain ATCC 38755 / EP155) TaxID=660469 RepID=A0A9P4YBF7_CRYP1|nr:uncharacterized protein M406DRAFT_32933 [Cryphonectria parasitica EP155]KAF3770392.1 hypothetical protein M406DRAFT_32933 [Cryphonectria parasitica EP155]